jgi:F-type H+-transporting ATPase subunit delta
MLRNSRSILSHMKLTLGSPRESIFAAKQVEAVTVPGVEGYFTLTHNHSLVVAQLKPGLITVKLDSHNTQEFFVSDGFCFFNHNADGTTKAEISGVEIVPVAALDKDKAVQLLAELNAGPKESEWDKAKVSLGTNLLQQVMKFAK